MRSCSCAVEWRESHSCAVGVVVAVAEEEEEGGARKEMKEGWEVHCGALEERERTPRR